MSKSKIHLTNNDFMKFFKEQKSFKNLNANFPIEGNSVCLDAVGLSSKEKYLMDVNRKRCTLSRITYQQRMKKSIVLLRLDIDNKPHKNPDGNVIPGTHLHVYREGFNDAWAYPLDSDELKVLAHDFDFKGLISLDQERRFKSFCLLCNFINYPLWGIPLDMK
uniref:DUF6978 family protein n=1 Tax=uncultured Allisonella sp. TaxID=339338 RepID=UPI0028050088|nr:hypothetical protein [uncultured Allisonella sp.]